MSDMYVLFSVPANGCLHNLSVQNCLVSPSNILLLKKRSVGVYGTESKSRPIVKQYLIVSALLRVFHQTHLSCYRQGTPEEPYSSALCSCIVSNLKPCNLFNASSLLSLQNLYKKYFRSLGLIFFRFVLNSMSGTCVSCIRFPLWIHLWHSTCELFL